MTKRQLIHELHNRGEMWANMEYSKKELEQYLRGYDRASKMTMEELIEELKKQGKWH